MGKEMVTSWCTELTCISRRTPSSPPLRWSLQKTSCCSTKSWPVPGPSSWMLTCSMDPGVSDVTTKRRLLQDLNKQTNKARELITFLGSWKKYYDDVKNKRQTTIKLRNCLKFPHIKRSIKYYLQGVHKKRYFDFGEPYEVKVPFFVDTLYDLLMNYFFWFEHTNKPCVTIVYSFETRMVSFEIISLINLVIIRFYEWKTARLSPICPAPGITGKSHVKHLVVGKEKYHFILFPKSLIK